MESTDLVVINGQLCNKDVALLIIDKVLPTALAVVAKKVNDGRHKDEVKEAAKTVVEAAISAISLKSLVAPKS
ncbi:hypothetical protein [Klebsiella michiganensis]|uniref:hypothetical protein n=1 Tax=Klebsiella michiganensis TaxID=1134687 RepID=UPI0027C85C5D|nr:hypothetical protein [Klebsiella michiganensis]MDQ2563461.1 hypothetical protein [Klebsiella michiganensis]HDF2355496.1 hypothetical protein [Klebsiella michiganensis]